MYVLKKIPLSMLERNSFIRRNSKLEVGNYRPVSILSIFSKILEIPVYTQLETYLVKKNTLCMYINQVSEKLTQLILV